MKRALFERMPRTYSVSIVEVCVGGLLPPAFFATGLEPRPANAIQWPATFPRMGVVPASNPRMGRDSSHCWIEQTSRRQA
jgi:hypothetical protein